VNASRAVDPPQHGAAKRRWLWALALLVFALAFQGSRALWDPDEGRYAHVALEMLRTGDWLTPMLHHQVPHFSKPPLTYWSIAASVSLLGRTEWAVRLPNALAFVFTVLLVARMARHLVPENPRLAGLVHATSLYPFVAANIVTTDTLLTAAVALGMAGFVDLCCLPERQSRSRYVMWGGFGLAFLTKGPPGLLALGAALVFTGVHLKAAGLRRLFAAGPLVVFLLLAFGWYGLQIRTHPGLLAYLIGAEVGQRVLSDSFHRNAGLRELLKVYLPVLVAGSLPWWPLALRRAWASRSARGTKVAGQPWNAWWRVPERLFLGLWIALPLAVFLISTSRLPLYLLQLSPAASLALARPLAKGSRYGRRAQVAVALWALTLVGLKAYGASVNRLERDGRQFAQQVRALSPTPPHELVFVDHRPRYSSSFYLDAEIEEVDLEELAQGDPSYKPTADRLDKEVREREAPRLFLVPSRREEALRNGFARLGLSANRLGQVDKFIVYHEPRPIVPGLSAQPPGGSP
jgi:4-amino-4-deoxy-L-arabinose transferase-like glycosyltransferase